MGLRLDEIQHLKRLKKLFVYKDANVERRATVRPTVSPLAQLGAADAIGVLDDFAVRDPKGDLGRLAAGALDWIGTRTKS